jgi:hypothetical protein
MDVATPSLILLYRYLDATAALKTIEFRSFRISRIKDLNDPFEWRLGFNGHDLQHEAELAAWGEAVLERRNKATGIISYSATSKDPVLWSHYADQHRGVAFEIRRRADEMLKKINYLPERATIDVNKYNQLRHSKDKLREYLRPIVVRLTEQKSPSWKYEQEYRDNFNLQKTNFYDLRDGYFHIKIPDNFLMRVILGWRCQLKETDMENLLKKVGLHSTKVVRAKLSQSTYEVVC